jgi:16S rRNA (guanine527-N7)-methyltransferase
MDANLKNILKEGSKFLGIDLSPKQLHKFALYLLRLKKWNRHINLTGLRGDREIVIKHFLDSLTPFSLLKPRWHLLDIGTGAGFPGIPLKMAIPSLKLTLVESHRKRVSFLKEIIGLLELKEVDVMQTYLNTKRSTISPSSFDAVISRATLPLAKYLRLAQPFVKRGGVVIAMVGLNTPIPSLELKRLNLELASTKSLILPFSQIKREILEFKKL